MEYTQIQKVVVRHDFSVEPPRILVLGLKMCIYEKEFLFWIQYSAI